MKLITVFFALITMTTCGNSKNAATVDKQYTKALNGKFTVTQINGSKTSAIDLTISFNDSLKTISGYSGCNRFSGTYEVTGNSLKIGPLATTKKACTPDRNAVESQFLNLLDKIDSFEYLKNELILKEGETNLLVTSIAQEEFIITYQAMTRGFFEKIWINQKSINFSNDYNLKIVSQVNCPSNEWDDLINLIKGIDVTKLPDLEAPSKTNQYDAAAGATLEIGLQGSVYKTSVFDHGNPPKSIEQIVNKVLSMKKLAEKQ